MEVKKMPFGTFFTSASREHLFSALWAFQLKRHVIEPEICSDRIAFMFRLTSALDEPPLLLPQFSHQSGASMLPTVPTETIIDVEVFDVKKNEKSE